MRLHSFDRSIRFGLLSICSIDSKREFARDEMGVCNFGGDPLRGEKKAVGRGGVTSSRLILNGGAGGIGAVAAEELKMGRGLRRAF